MKLLIVEDIIGISSTIARVMQHKGHKECQNGGLASHMVRRVVHHLRKKLSSWHADQYIQTIKGSGYILRINE